MIDAKDLRVGNLVTALGWELLSVESILSGTYRAFLHTLDKEYLAGFALSDVNPIPLDEQWLERVGYLEEDNTWISDKCDKIFEGKGLISIGMKDGKFYRFIHCDDQYYSHCGREIPYLHKLQNLTYEMTGNELIIK